MAEVIRGNANLAPAAFRGNYIAATAHYMAKIYYRNVAQKQPSVSKLAQSAFSEDKGPRGLEKGPLAF